MMTHTVKVGPPSVPLSGAWWPLWHGLGLFLGDLAQVRLPVRLVLVQGPGECRGLFLGHLRLSLGPHGLGLRGFLPGSFGGRPARSAFPGGSRLVWLLASPSIMMLATFLISPMTTASWGSAPQRAPLPGPGS
jgi:hypothetical protein